MEITTIKDRIMKNISNAKVIVKGDGCSCEAIVVSDEFKKMTLLARQRKVMIAVDDFLKSGELHALALKTYTEDEWLVKNKTDA